MPEGVNDNCPGCLDCGDKCDVWNGNHLWTEFVKNGQVYSMCDFCGMKVFHE